MRGQMKIGESMVILVIFFFLLVFGLVYYIKFTIEGLDKKAEERAQLIAIQSVQKIQFLPELQCTNEGTVKYNCMDVMKLDTFNRIPDEKTAIYETLFPNTHISVRQVYPSPANWDIYGSEKALSSRYYFPVPVALFNATNEQYNMGYVEIRVYI